MNIAPQPESDTDRRTEGDLRALEHYGDHLRQVAAERDEGRQEERDLPGRPRPQRSHDHDVQMNYRQLTLRGQRLTGLQIKEQAISAGIPHIRADFHLTVERAGRDAERTIGDNDKWSVHDGDCFTAVKPDDNS